MPRRSARVRARAGAHVHRRPVQRKHVRRRAGVELRVDRPGRRPADRRRDHARDPPRVRGRLRSAGAERQLHDDCGRAVSPTSTVAPGSASRRTSASAIGPSAGETTELPTRPTPRSPRRSSSPVRGRRRQAQPAQMAVGLALVEQPRDGLLADVAALGEAHRALVQRGLLRDRRVVHVQAEARAPGLDAQDLGGRLGDRDARRARPAPRVSRSVSAASQSRSTPTSVRTASASMPSISTGCVCVLVRVAERLRRRHVATRGRPDQRQQPALARCACAAPRRSRPCSGGSCRTAPAATSARCRAAVRARSERAVDREDAQVAEHLALRREERGVAAFAGAQVGQLVGHLAVEELDGAGAASARACRARSGRAARSPRSARAARRRPGLSPSRPSFEHSHARLARDGPRGHASSRSSTRCPTTGRTSSWTCA